MLLDYYPRVVKQIREMQEICKAEQPEFDNINIEVDRLLNNMFISTSDEYGISRFEDELGIIPTPGQTLEERRIALLLRIVKKNLSFKDIINLIHNYSQQIDLVADYDNDELMVIVGDETNDSRAIYKALDSILGLNIYIYFLYEVFSVIEFKETVNIVEIETTVQFELNNSEKNVVEMETDVNILETFEDATAIKQKNLWYLDGKVKLDGSRKLDGIEIKEVL